MRPAGWVNEGRGGHGELFRLYQEGGDLTEFYHYPLTNPRIYLLNP